MVHRLNHGIDVGGKSIGQPTGFVIGVEANPGAINDDEERRRFLYKVEAGAEFAVTRPVFDLAVLERFLKLIENCKIPIILGILPLASYKMAEFLNYEVPGCSIPDSIMERMRETDAREEGIRVAQEFLEEAKDMVQGVQVRGPFDRYETPIEVLGGLK